MGRKSLQFTRKDVQGQVKRVAQEVKKHNIDPATVVYKYDKGRIRVILDDTLKENKTTNILKELKVRKQYNLKELEDKLYYSIQPVLSHINKYGFLPSKDSSIQVALEDFVKSYEPGVKIHDSRLTNFKNQTMYRLVGEELERSVHKREQLLQRMMNIIREVSFIMINSGNTIVTDRDWVVVLSRITENYKRTNTKYMKERAVEEITSHIKEGKWDEIFKVDDDIYREEFYTIMQGLDIPIYDIIYKIKDTRSFVNNDYYGILEWVEPLEDDYIENAENLLLFNVNQEGFILEGLHGDNFLRFIKSWRDAWLNDYIRICDDKEEGYFNERERYDALEVGIDEAEKLIEIFPKSKALKEKWG